MKQHVAYDQLQVDQCLNSRATYLPGPPFFAISWKVNILHLFNAKPRTPSDHPQVARVLNSKQIYLLGPPPFRYIMKDKISASSHHETSPVIGSTKTCTNIMKPDTLIKWNKTYEKGIYQKKFTSRQGKDLKRDPPSDDGPTLPLKWKKGNKKIERRAFKMKKVNWQKP